MSQSSATMIVHDCRCIKSFVNFPGQLVLSPTIARRWLAIYAYRTYTTPTNNKKEHSGKVTKRKWELHRMYEHFLNALQKSRLRNTIQLKVVPSACSRRTYALAYLFLNIIIQAIRNVGKCSMFRALFDLESDQTPILIKVYRNRVFVSETWNDNRNVAKIDNT